MKDKSNVFKRIMYIHREITIDFCFALPWFQSVTPNSFRPGMKLEAIDKQSTSLHCVATVVDVLGERILIHFDGWENIYDYWCDLSSPYIHPVGWCQENGKPISPPKGKWEHVNCSGIKLYRLQPNLRWNHFKSNNRLLQQKALQLCKRKKLFIDWLSVQLVPYHHHIWITFAFKLKYPPVVVQLDSQLNLVAINSFQFNSLFQSISNFLLLIFVIFHFDFRLFLFL